MNCKDAKSNEDESTRGRNLKKVSISRQNERKNSMS